MGVSYHWCLISRTLGSTDNTVRKQLGPADNTAQKQHRRNGVADTASTEKKQCFRPDNTGPKQVGSLNDDTLAIRMDAPDNTGQKWGRFLSVLIGGVCSASLWGIKEGNYIDS